MIRTIIVEDELAIRQTLHEQLERNFTDIEIISECDNAEDAMIDILRLRPELTFLDIQMSGKDGIWLAQELLKMKGSTFTPPDIIFTTGYTYFDYLLKAFEMSAIDYLIKPISIENLEKAMARYKYRNGIAVELQSRLSDVGEKQLLRFKSFNGVFLLHPDDIVYVEADRDYAFMFFANGAKEEVFERLGEIEKKLPPEYFLRAGKSIVVNRKYIRKITDVSIMLVTPFMSNVVKISRNAIRQLKETLLR